MRLSKGAAPFQNGTERKFEASLGATTNTWWEHVYDAFGRETAQLPRASQYDTADRSWYRRVFGWNNEGTMTSVVETSVPSGKLTFVGRKLLMTPATGLGNVYRTLSVNGATYQYFYDASNRRRLKIYPSGRSDEFFYDGDHLIEDQGLVSTTVAGSGHVYDQYVWLGNMPVAVVRQRLSETGLRDTVSTDCKRNGEAAPCGTFFIVNDYLPKPIAMIDSAGRLARVGEYDAFGRVNTVSMRADAPAYTDVPPYPFGKYKVSQGAIANFTVPLRGGAAGRARVNYALVNTTNANDITDVRAGTKCSTGTSMVKGGYQGQLNSFATPWFGVTSGTPYCVWWAAYAEGGYGGAVTASFEYQLYENSVVTPSWLPLRFPGQYADGESQFFENWNRFYDPTAGTYSSEDPVLTVPLVKLPEPFGYGRNNPVVNSDSTGLAPDDLVKAWSKQMMMGAAPDSISQAQLQLLRAVVTGDWNKAAALATALGGRYPAIVQSLQAAYDKANQIAGPCYRVQNNIYNALRGLQTSCE